MTWVTGQKLQNGKYIIQQVLGQGGFGITYKALQVYLNRPVVIKTPNEYLNDDPEYDKYIERFIAEGQTLARLSQDPHPHIVGVIELFQEGNTHCLVMEFVPGENLFQAVKRRGALPEAEIVTCIRQIGEALMVVHQAGLVHRDAHPGNIMLRSNGKAVLIDFGIAKQIIPATQSSTDKAANDGFAPYEQRHKGSRDPRVDIYCLAASLYYGVTGQNPTNSLARKLDNERLIPPQELISSISNELNQAILEGMALEEEDRPPFMQSWLEMLSHKHQILNVEEENPTVTPPPPVKDIHKTEDVYPESTIEKKPISNKPDRKVPWVSLTILLLLYSLMGYILTASNAPFLLWAEAVALALAMTGAGAWSWSWAEAVALALAMTGPGALAVAGILAFAGAGAGAGALAVAGVGAVAWAGAWAWAWPMDGAWPKLEKSFNKFHTFLIVTVTSNVGLGLGWIAYRLFKPVG
ncbi:MAG: serine/threonine protein kinase [Dolichospermum sp. JUN01]|nr:serine/threonine protein kinase [Dolichospermum sp. JUN01]